MFYISSIKLNWYGHLEFDKEMIFSPGVNLVIGKNGSGKTSLLRMIDGIQRNTNKGLDQEASEKYQENSELVKVTCKKKDMSDTMAIAIRNGGTSNWQNHQLFDQQIRFITSDRRVSMASAATSPISSISKDISMPEVGAEIDISLEFTQAFLKDLWKRIEDLTEQQNVGKEIIESYQHGLVDFEKDIRFDLKRSSNPIYFVDFRDREIQINDLSSGEKEYLYFYAFLRRVKDEQDKIILIDEPELHLHSSQLRKLCELIAQIGEKNQVIIATHSGEILQSFINTTIVLLNKGQITNIKSNGELKKALEEIGLPIDPSVFTAHWICAENDPNLPLKGIDAPKTPMVLEWLFGKDITKRFWSFGHNREKADAIIEGIKQVSTQSTSTVSLSVILDGDKRIDSVKNYPPNNTASNKLPKGVLYWDFWEIENLFLSPTLLNEVIETKNGVSGFDQFWVKVEEKQEELFNSINKTILKNNLRHYSVDKIIKNKPQEDFEKWKDTIMKLEFDHDGLKTKFQKIINDKDWCWIPGKEAIVFALDIEPNFWKKIIEIVDTNKFKTLMETELSIKTILDKYEQNR